jgi:hypothetical protein
MYSLSTLFLKHLSRVSSLDVISHVSNPHIAPEKHIFLCIPMSSVLESRWNSREQPTTADLQLGVLVQLSDRIIINYFLILNGSKDGALRSILLFLWT